MNKGTPTLTAVQVERLAAMVEARLAAFGDPAIRAPRACDYRAERHWLPSNYFDLSVDIDIGTTVLTLRSGGSWHRSEFGPDTDLKALSDAIGMHVALAREDDTATARLAAAEATFRAKIKRDRSFLDLASVRFAPARTDRPESTAGREVWVRVNLLDDMLLPYTEIINSSGTRAICRDLKRLGDDQTRRLTTLKRLSPLGAALGIEAMAEHAIIASGRDVSDVVRSTIGRRRPNNGHGPRAVLQGDANDRHISVIFRDGCLWLEADLPEIWWTWDKGIVLSRTFPDTVMAALAGRSLPTVVDHPLLPGNAVIAGATSWGPHQTKIRLETTARPIDRADLGWGAC